MNIKRKPQKEDFGYVESTGFDSEPSGYVVEGGEEAYEEALKQWESMQNNASGNKNAINNKMTQIVANAEFLFELKSKQEWVNKVPRILPSKTRAGETLIWLDKNGNVFEIGSDFMEAEKHDTYPCKVFRLESVSSWAKKLNKN